MSEQSITAKLMQPFPPEAIKTRQGGGNSRLSYVEGHTVIHRLIDATANHFDLRVLNIEQKGDLLTALVELTIPGLGSRQHMGVQKVSERGGEDLVKGAITDAMKKAATLFGVGLELYGPDYGADDTSTTPALTAAQERTIAESRDMAEQATPYPAVVNHLRQLQADATPDQWTAIRRALAAIKAKHYQVAEA